MENENVTKLAESISKFSAQFYKETAAFIPGKNLVMSPMSAEIVLALLSLGAKGETLKQMNTALYLTDSEFTKSAFKPAIKKLNETQGVTLNIANKVFIPEGPTYTPTKIFKDDAESVFQSEIENVNFGNNVQAAITINSWVEDKTNSKIRDLVQPSSLSDHIRLVLVNAIYFKGLWDQKFKKEATRKRDFFLNAKDKIEVDMMHQNKVFPYAEIKEWDAKIIELPYEKKEMSMIIILPNQVEGLSALEEKLAGGANLNDALNRLGKINVELALPMFTIMTELNLTQILPKLGFSRIFTHGDAEFGGILESDEPLHVSNAIQMAFINVDENGTEAGAATILDGMRGSSLYASKKIEFIAEKLFIFMLTNDDNDVIFQGRVSKPK